MRGKVFFIACVELKFRITPAYAGKSICHVSYCVCYRDHPRVCGEKTKKIP